jgi:hypothetical protein
MAESATTTSGSRTFSDGVMVSWTPSTTTNTVAVAISIGGSPVWEQTFQGNSEQSVDAEGDNYSLKGDLTVEFGADGSDGSLSGDLTWTVSGSSHSYSGLIGAW